MSMSRDDHLAWAKTRALEYVDRYELMNAVNSMLSDLNAHDGFDKVTSAFLATLGMMDVINGDREAVRRWVEGFH